MSKSETSNYNGNMEKKCKVTKKCDIVARREGGVSGLDSVEDSWIPTADRRMEIVWIVRDLHISILYLISLLYAISGS